MCVPNATLGSDNVSVSDPGFPCFMVTLRNEDTAIQNLCGRKNVFQVYIIFIPVRVTSDQLEVKKCAVFSFSWVISFLKKKGEISPKFLNVNREGTIMLTCQFANQPPILLIQTAVLVLVVKNSTESAKKTGLSVLKNNFIF